MQKFIPKLKEYSRLYFTKQPMFFGGDNITYLINEGILRIKHEYKVGIISPSELLIIGISDIGFFQQNTTIKSHLIVVQTQY